MTYDNQNHPTGDSKHLHDVQSQDQHPKAGTSLSKDDINRKMEAPDTTAADKRPVSDADEAVERENQGNRNGHNESGSSAKKADFESPGDDPA